MSWVRHYFKLVAIIFIGFGIVAAAIPDEYIALLGVDASVGGRLWGRAFGATSLAFGVIPPAGLLARTSPAGFRAAGRSWIRSNPATRVRRRQVPRLRLRRVGPG